MFLRFFFLCWLICQPIIGCDINNVDFIFTTDLKWKSTLMNFKIDVYESESSEKKIYLTQPTASFLGSKLNGAIYQMIYLPDIEKKEMSISLRSKPENLYSSYLKIQTYNNTGKQIYTVSSEIENKNNEWVETKLLVPLQRARFVNIIIETQGTNNIKDKQALYLDQLDIKIDDKNLNDYTIPDLSTKIEPEECYPLSLVSPSLETILKNNFLSGKHIIAIGETVHGAFEFGEMFYGLIREMVEHNNCKLIILEFPIDMMLKWNLFIQQNTDFTYTDLEVEMEDYSFSPRQFFEILLWLKEYNRQHEKKVRIAGMDQPSLGKRNTFALADYTYFFKQKTQNALFDTLSTFLLKQKYQEALYWAEQNPDIIKFMGEEEWLFFQQAISKHQSLFTSWKSPENDALKISIKDPSFYILPQQKSRDQKMWINIHELISLKVKTDEKVLIYGHLGHLGHVNLNRYDDLPLGHYLREYYGDKYYVIGLLAGIGTYTTINPQDSISRAVQLSDLLTPSTNSLESICANLSTCFFCPINVISEPILQIRHIGRYAHKNQFEYYPLNSMDAFIFIPEIQGFDVPEIWLDKSNIYKITMDRYYKTMERNNYPRKRLNQ